MKFKLIIFDLDLTLLQTSDLESFRGHANTGDVNEDYRRRLHHSANNNNRVQISEECILRIREMHDNAHIAIFTTSPRTYTETLLEIYYPNTTWDAIVTYEDVKNTKPAPEGIHLASQMAGVNWGDQIGVISVSVQKLPPLIGC